MTKRNFLTRGGGAGKAYTCRIGSIYVSIYVSDSLRGHLLGSAHGHLSTYRSTCMIYAYMLTCSYAYVYVCVYKYIYIYIHICMCVYIYIYREREMYVV